jgi:pyrroline-5-carboxylate reductase
MLKFLKKIIRPTHFCPTGVQKKFSKKNDFLTLKEMEQTIGIIGYGSLGQSIAKRATELGYKVITSNGDNNQEVANNSDILAICVKPYKISEVAEEIRTLINGTSIVSFMAAVPIERLREAISPKTQRAMTNLGLDSFSCTDGDERITRFCETLSRNGVEKTDIESQVDLFTIAIGCLPGIAAWQFEQNTENADAWLIKWTAFLQEKTGIAGEVFDKIIREVKEANEYEETVRRVKTPHGVTEIMLDKLEANTNIDLEELLQAATTRTEEIAKRV